MPFREDLLRLRRFDAGIRHHAAFLFWNLKGILAERWGHGPHFSAYNASHDRMQLKQGSDRPQDRVAQAGLKECGLWSEREDQDYTELTELTAEWLTDCLDVLEPQTVDRFSFNSFWSYPVEERNRPRVNDALVDLTMSETPAFNFEQFEGAHRGLSFSWYDESSEDGEVRHANALFGLYGPPHVGSQFEYTPDPDEWGLGLMFQYMEANPDGIDDPEESISDFLESSMRISRDQVHGTITAVINSA